MIYIHTYIYIYNVYISIYLYNIYIYIYIYIIYMCVCVYCGKCNKICNLHISRLLCIISSQIGKSDEKRKFLVIFA